MEISDLLAFTVKNKASDLHLSAGLPPMIRVHGDIRRINLPPLAHHDVHDMVYDIMNDYQRKIFEDTLFAWRNAKTGGNLQQILSFYAADFNSNGKTLEQWTPTLKSELSKAQGRTIQLKDLSYLRWTDSADTMVATFGEVADGVRTGLTKRQYWVRQNKQWKIFFEGVI